MHLRDRGAPSGCTGRSNQTCGASANYDSVVLPGWLGIDRVGRMHARFELQVVFIFRFELIERVHSRFSRALPSREALASVPPNSTVTSTLASAMISTAAW